MADVLTEQYPQVEGGSKTLADAVRPDFPVLGRTVNEKRLVYLDNAATTQKPVRVIEALRDYYANHNANVHRGVHKLSQEATELFEGARKRVASFINAPEEESIIFVRGCTEAINLVAASYGRPNLKPGDEILLTAMEHHSNIVPWQLVAEETGAVIKVIPMNDRGELELDRYEELLTDKTRIVGVVHTSNSLGTVNDLKTIVHLAHARDVPVLADGAQAAAHGSIDVQDLDVDFYTLSGHKVYGPTGIGALYGRMELLEEMPPWQGGGDMIRSVTFEKTSYAPSPSRFEAGTPNIAGAIGFGEALDYLDTVGMDRIVEWEHNLLAYGTEQLSAIDGLRLVGTADHKTSILSFVLDYAHPHDIGTILDGEGVAVRTGHHCTQPVMARFGIPATTRASLSFYNTTDEIDRLVDALKKVKEIFG